MTCSTSKRGIVVVVVVVVRDYPIAISSSQKPDLRV